MESCFHQLVTYSSPAPKGKPYRYRCLKCREPFKILTGRLLTTKEQRDMLNLYGGTWPWDKSDPKSAPCFACGGQKGRIRVCLVCKGTGKAQRIENNDDKVQNP